MNIVFTEIPSSQPGRSDINPVDHSNEGQFSRLVNRQMRDDDTAAARVDGPQLVEIKEENEVSQNDVLNSELSSESLHNYSEQFALHISETGEAQFVRPDAPMHSDESTETPAYSTVYQIQSVDESLGQALPVNGMTLPHLTDIAGRGALPEVASKQALPVTGIPLKTLDASTGLAAGTEDGDDTMFPRFPQGANSVESAIAGKADGFIEKLQIAGMNESQLSSSIANSGSDIHAGLVRLNHQAVSTNFSQVLPPQMETLTLSNPRDQQAISQGLGDRIQWMVNQKLNTATIRMDPPALGRLDVQIQVADDVTNVTIHTQHAQTRDLIDNASIRLREYLQENGYQNVNVDVSHQQQQQASDHPGGSSPGADSNGSALPASDGIDDNSDYRYIGSDSVVDYFA